MMTLLMSSSALLLITLTFNGMDSSHGANILGNTLPVSERLVLQERDEDPMYPDFDSGEQDRWPTLEELGLNKRFLTHKRDEENLGGSEGRMAFGKRPITVNRPVAGSEDDKEHIVSSLYDLLSSPPRPAPQRRIMDNLKDLYAAELMKRHRLPRSADDNTLNTEPTEVVQETSSNGQVTESA
ncbi:hypothetical protein GDO81_003781 [Engystomops pustulosus]|uniref:Uncharacterized protein n=1 Tax=Engystomops pustulosus TaxID=76066 RepID=A0AAV7A6X6_ENGPU|nr:hypothetical protein GDO81_003781 [Engystomops pustulosus]